MHPLPPRKAGTSRLLIYFGQKLRQSLLGHPREVSESLEIPVLHVHDLLEVMFYVLRGCTELLQRVKLVDDLPVSGWHVLVLHRRFIFTSE